MAKKAKKVRPPRLTVQDSLASISQWQHDHERHDDKRFEEARAATASIHENMATKSDMQELKNLLQPMLDTYQTVGRLGRWGKGLLAVIVTIVTLIVALKGLLR